MMSDADLAKALQKGSGVEDGNREPNDVGQVWIAGDQVVCTGSQSKGDQIVIIGIGGESG